VFRDGVMHFWFYYVKLPELLHNWLEDY
jgi:hypothetical protein